MKRNCRLSGIIAFIAFFLSAMLPVLQAQPGAQVAGTSRAAQKVRVEAKSPLKVLFVGYDPARPMPEVKRTYPGMMTEEGFKADYPVRMPAFKALLEQYFAVVKTIDCRDWKPADSDPYDVTVFDFKTRELEEAKMEKGADGQTNYTPARYLPDDFSKPVVFISSTASEMGARIGLKLDWLCLCLSGDAHHLRSDHPIFQGPLQKVTPTLQLKPTPEGIYHYMSGDTVPKQIPMWQVQTKGYTDPGGESVRIGLVSRGNRFTEGPDAEFISSGVCQKDVGAVALGRHGNFFLWGFGASPAQLTDEAKRVFVNAVAYISRFNGRRPITMKYNEKMATTDDVKEIIGSADRGHYEDMVKIYTEFNEANKARKATLDAKKAAGEKLTKEEEESMTYLERPQPIPTWEEYLKQVMGPLAAKFGTDAAGFQKYLRDNLPYMYCYADRFFEYKIDEDARQIGVSNHSLAFLDKTLAMLKKNDRPDLALRVLQRYTGENFTTAKEWEQWLWKNRKKLYFSETNGYRFMVDTYN